jgi:hypothetical protein
MQEAGCEWFAAVCHDPSSGFTSLRFCSAMQRQLSDDPGGPQTSLTLPTVLIAKHPQLAFAVSSQPMWTEKTWKFVIHRGYWLPAPNRSIDRCINRFCLSRDACPRPVTLPAYAMPCPIMEVQDRHFMTQ